MKPLISPRKGNPNIVTPYILRGDAVYFGFLRKIGRLEFFQDVL
jgi:hypothetical protein